MPSIRADDEICSRFEFAVWSFCAHADHAPILDEQIDDLGFHVQLKSWKTFGMTREKIKKIPLRHEGDEFAAGGEPCEICDWHDLPVYYPAQLPHFLMRLLQELVKQAKLVHQFERGRMNRVATEIAIEVGVLFQHRYLHTCPRKQITSHHSGGPATHDHAASLQLFNYGFHG